MRNVRTTADKGINEFTVIKLCLYTTKGFRHLVHVIEGLQYRRLVTFVYQSHPSEEEIDPLALSLRDAASTSSGQFLV